MLTIRQTRFFIHPEIRALESTILDKGGYREELCMLFPSALVASRCKEFIALQLERRTDGKTRLLDGDTRIVPLVSSSPATDTTGPASNIWVLFIRHNLYSYAKEFWQHTGDGISSRRAAFAHMCLEQGYLDLKGQNSGSSNQQLPRGPGRYSRRSTIEPGITIAVPGPSGNLDKGDTGINNFVEIRYGRNLGAAAVQQAKLAIKQRISGIICPGITSTGEILSPARTKTLSASDVYLSPTGMSAIFSSYRIVQKCFGSPKMVQFGFPYLDTLKILQKFGNGCIFLGNGDESDLNELEAILESGERIAGLFCEFPSNPLLKSPNLSKLRELANKYKFVIVVDETIGNFINVDVLPYADILVSSLTKIFSGDSNVMGGSCIISPNMPYYQALSEIAAGVLEDNYWGEDAIVMERNSRDFASRVLRINKNAEALADLFLRWQPTIVKRVFYPKYDDSRENYEQCRCQEGGYGGLLSVTFSSHQYAIQFYDFVKTAKGPSLGTNFTLTSPYALLAHYKELDWVAQYGVESHLIRVSVGLEDPGQLLSIFEDALRQLLLPDCPAVATNQPDNLLSG
ncbi:hypothetical protein TWF696_007090 [Orbilia brochopaga]|uniref:Cystathionine gamma-synthase n=1 Tax=Orbilia brochopaga TaxID=3140254 RepID=A0AAV9URK2_9PEZI